MPAGWHYSVIWYCNYTHSTNILKYLVFFWEIRLIWTKNRGCFDSRFSEDYVTHKKMRYYCWSCFENLKIISNSMLSSRYLLREKKKQKEKQEKRKTDICRKIRKNLLTMTKFQYFLVRLTCNMAAKVASSFSFSLIWPCFQHILPWKNLNIGKPLNFFEHYYCKNNKNYIYKKVFNGKKMSCNLFRGNYWFFLLFFHPTPITSVLVISHLNFSFFFSFCLFNIKDIKLQFH